MLALKPTAGPTKFDHTRSSLMTSYCKLFQLVQSNSILQFEPTDTPT